MSIYLLENPKNSPFGNYLARQFDNVTIYWVESDTINNAWDIANEINKLADSDKNPIIFINATLTNHFQKSPQLGWGIEILKEIRRVNFYGKKSVIQKAHIVIYSIFSVKDN